MPATILGELRFEATRKALDVVLDQDAELVRVAAGLSDDLYAAIGGLQDHGAVKAGLVGLRRSIYNDRVPREREWNSTVRAALSSGLARRVDDWLLLKRRRDQALRRYEDAFAAEVRRKRLVLREACRDPWFLRGLAISSPHLSRELEKWLSPEGRAPKAPMTARIIRYVCRSAAKTSLFSSFGVAGFVGWTGDPRPVPRPPASETRGVTDIDGRLVEQILDWIVTDPEFRERLRVRVNPSAFTSGDAILFVRHDRVSGVETLSSMRATPTVSTCLRLIRGLRAPALADVRRTLAGSSGSDEATVARYADRLVGTGLLEILPPPLDPAREPIAAIAGWLEDRAGNPEPAKSFRRLSQLIGMHVPVADVPAQCARLTDLETAISRLRADLSLDAPPPPKIDGEVLRPAHYPFHETCVAVRPLPSPLPAIDGAVAADLERARRLLRIFDSSVVTGTAMTDFFLERYGAQARVPLMELYHDASRLKSSEASPAGEALADIGLAASVFTAQHWIDVIGRSEEWRRPGTRRLREHWRQVAELLRRSPCVNGVVRVAPDDVERVTGRWPARAGSGRSSTFHVQVGDGDEGATLVLNEVNSGYGKNRSRIHHLLERAGAAPEPLTTVPPGEDAVFAELGGLFGGSMNQRTATAAYEIGFPNLVSSRAPGEVLPLPDLVVVYDGSRDDIELRSMALGKRVVPLHNGMMAPFLLPGLAAMITQVFGASQHLRTSAFASLDWLRPEAGPRHEARHFPRVTIGAVVLFRATCAVATADVPRPRGGEPDVDFILRFRRWSVSRGVPERSFTRPSTEDSGYLSKDRKPLYLDLHIPFTVMDFVRHLRDHGGVVFEEALPDPVAVGRRHQEARVSELVIELTTAGEPI